MNAPSQIVDRIRKLLELSKSSNEHEAAAAAARAAELMRKHDLNEAMLRVTDSERHAEPIVEEGITGTKTEGRRVAWKVFIASGAAQALGIEMFSCGGKILGMGRTSAIRTWDYLCQYLYREVDRLADEAWDGPIGHLARRDAGYDQPARSWKNAFRVGASGVIAKRLRRQASEQETNKRSDVAAAAALTGPDTANQTSRETQALAIIDHDRAEVEAAYMRRSASFGKATPIGQISSRSGLVAGRAAGATVNLTGGGRGLPAPAKAIKG
jgi:hypothetical protein